MKKIIPFLFLSLLTSLPSFADDNAVQFWQIFDFDWKADERLTLGLSKQLRYEDTLTAVESDITDVGIDYKMEKWLTLQGQYRFNARGDEKRNRFLAGMVIKFDFGSMSVSNRTRFQNEHITSSEESDTKWVFRDRLQFSFCRHKKLQPFFGGEIFLGMNEESKSENKFRLTGGIDYDISKAVQLSLLYHFEHDLGEKTNETVHVLAGRFRLSF